MATFESLSSAIQDKISDYHADIILFQKTFNELTIRLNKHKSDLFKLTNQLGEIKPHQFIDSTEGANDIPLPGQNESEITLLSIYREWYLVQKSKVPHDISEATIAKYSFVFDNFVRFLKAKKIESINISSFEESEMQDYYNFIRKERGAAHNHAVRHIDHIIKVIDYSIIKKYYQGNNRLKLVKPKKNNKIRVNYLTEEEVSKLKKYHDFDSPNMEIVRDGFLFQCYTGISYLDFHKLTEKHIKRSNDRLYFNYQRAKNDEFCIIPIIPEAMELINKYRTFDYSKHASLSNTKECLLPVFKNTYTNKLLKQIAVNLNLEEEKFCTHTGRRTFAMTFLNRGAVSIETISKMLGHTSIKTTQKYYARVSELKVMREMEAYTLSI